MRNEHGALANYSFAFPRLLRDRFSIAAALAIDALQGASYVRNDGRLMKASGLQEVKAGLAPNLARLWRYGVVLSGARDVADDLVQATCVRAIERADQFQSGTRLDRWLFSILRSIWLNELRSRRVREGGGFVDASEALVVDGEREIETNIFASQVLREVGGLPEAQREAVLLVYVEGLSYRESGRDFSPRRSAR